MGEPSTRPEGRQEGGDVPPGLQHDIIACALLAISNNYLNSFHQ
jgi:hypothetical protein